MAIPDFQEVMRPLLEFVSERGECSLREAIDALAERFGLSDAERRQLLPSGRQPVFNNRVGWARTYLKEAGLLEPAGRGRIRVTPRGHQVLASPPPRVDVRFLERFPEFVAFRARRREHQAAPEPPADLTPDEAMEAAYEQYTAALEADLLDRLRSGSPGFFEKVVADVLVAMGYGGSQAAQVVGGPGDEGIDAVIDQDPLGLDRVYVQAKRWGDRAVGRPEVQQFAGALQGRGAMKGVFITTGRFAREAEEYAARIPNRVVLVDGRRLVKLMVKYGVGVTRARTYELKRVDGDYFGEG
jgi:restriction system protein